MNRRALPEGSPEHRDALACDRLRNLLVFTASELGEGFYRSSADRPVSFYQLEGDSFHPDSHDGRTRPVRPVSNPGAVRTRVRLAIDFTSVTPSRRVEPSTAGAVVGASRASSFDLVGRGSARVVSRPHQTAVDRRAVVHPARHGRRRSISARETRRDGRAVRQHRSVVNDTRYLTSYVRDISLVDDGAYGQLDRASRPFGSFPSDLANPDLEYSGIYEDGWVGEESYALLAAGGPTRLVVRADVPDRPAQHLHVSVDGKPVFSESVKPGRLNVIVPLPASEARRRVALRWATSAPLPAPDSRPVAAQLRFVGLDPATRG